MLRQPEVWVSPAWYEVEYDIPVGEIPGDFFIEDATLVRVTSDCVGAQLHQMADQVHSLR